MDSHTPPLRDDTVARPYVKQEHLARIERIPKVAVLLATYNGAQFVEQQISSLKENTTRFTLHWLDDHSTDSTREIVRSSARHSCIPVSEWHQPRHLGLPRSFLQLLEVVEADIYLFCDQDDIWQPGKIDATVANLVYDMESPVLCFSETLLFNNNEPGILRSLSDVISRKKVLKTQVEMFTGAPGHAQGFTRPLREMYLTHKEIANTYGFMHDWWIHDITIVSGTVRMLPAAPAVLWRRHANSFCANISDDTVRSRLANIIGGIQSLRRALSRHAHGLVLAIPTLALGDQRDQLLEFARFMSTIDQRQPLLPLVQLVRRGALRLRLPGMILFSMVCLCSHATPSRGHGSNSRPTRSMEASAD